MDREAYKVIVGDCLEVMRGLPDSSVDSIVTDPPYGLNFMGKKWDYDVPSVEIWRECLRVLKPGGHLLAFAGTRTQHRMAVRIEDAGFEIRDMIAWVYGSGFPKSMDVTKAIDKLDAKEEQTKRRLRFTEWVRSSGVTSNQIDQATGTYMGGHYTTAASQPLIMSREHLEACRHLFEDIPEWVERECDIRSVESRNMAEREVVGQKRGVDTSKLRIACSTSAQGFETSPHRVYNITAPATDAARTWSGWGTALKPALEPITVARKTLIGTVAENVLRHGTGALNIDGCRVGTDQTGWGGGGSRLYEGGLSRDGGQPRPAIGRWPANLIHDGGDECVDLLKDAARFFYCAKASKRDRDEGMAGFEAKRTTFSEGTGLRNNGDGTPRNAEPSNRNHHPTVKPTDLMRYLCRLVTPPGGLVLDPFTGSGSTGRGAILEGFRFLGIERDPEYAKIAEARISASYKSKSEELL